MAKKERRSSWWKKHLKKTDKETQFWIDVLSGKTPMYFTEFGENIYASDVVQQAIYSIVTELKKLDPVHVRRVGNDIIGIDGNIQNVLDAPNLLMTTSDFIEKVAWTLLLNYNAFIFPVWDGNTLTALYPLQPSEVDFVEDAAGTLFVVFHFPNGYEGQVPYEDVIHLRYRFSVSEFMGGNEWGQPDFKPLLDTLKLNDSLLKGLAKSLHIQTTINGIIKLRTVVNQEEKVKKIEDFSNRLQSNESGFLAVDNIEEFTPIQKQVALLDNTVLEFIDKKIFRWFGVSIPFVDGTCTPQQYEAVYQKTLEPIVKSWGQAFTKGLFTNHAALGFKNQIVFYTKELIFMNTDQKIKLFDILVDSESCYKNEMRTAFGMRPLPELEGQLAASSNKTNAENNKQENGLASGENDAPAEGGDDMSNTDVAKVETDKVLNGAQTQSLIQTIMAYKEGTLTYDQTVNIISISIGITKEEAEELIGEPSEMNDGNGGVENE